MRNILLYIVIAFLLFLSCTTTSTDQQTETTNLSSDTTIVKTTGQLKPQLILTPQAKEVILNWGIYNSLSKDLDSLQSPTLTDLKRIIPRMLTLFENNEEAENADFNAIPDLLDVPMVRARLLAVETQVNVLQNQINKTSPDTSIISTELTGLFNAFQDFNLQINERFSKGIEDILKEFQEQENNDTAPVPDNIPQGKPKPVKWNPEG